MRNRTKTIISGTLHIVPESLQDAQDIYKYMGCDPEITRYTGWNPYRTLPETVAKIERDLHSEDDTYSWVIKKDGTFIGTIGAYDYRPEDASIEIGYSIARPFWGKGYAGSAVKAVAAFLLGEPHIQKLRAWSHKDNLASRKVLLNAGFRETDQDEEQINYELQE